MNVLQTIESMPDDELFSLITEYSMTPVPAYAVLTKLAKVFCNTNTPNDVDLAITLSLVTNVLAVRYKEVKETLYKLSQ